MSFTRALVVLEVAFWAGVFVCAVGALVNRCAG